MRRAIRDNALCAAMAGAGSLALAWLGLYGYGWSDYEVEAQPAVQALVGGHLSHFLALAPVYGGSLLERAPFALAPTLWGGGALAVYRMLALPCLLAGAVLGVWLVADMRGRGCSRLARAVALGLCVANPIMLRALELGHPEELLGGVLCVFGVLLAARGKPLAAGALIGLAIANKEWAVLALGPALLCLPPGARLRFLACSGALAAAILAPFAVGGSAAFIAGAHAAAAPPSSIFQPWQLWWFFGHHGPLVHGLFGVAKPGYRVGPAWAAGVSHPLIVLLGAALPGALWLRSRSARAAGARPTDARTALLLLALLLLLRCALDTWDTAYYTLPFLLALLAWETAGDERRPPLLALGATALVWVNCQWLPEHASADVQAAFFLAWSLPLTAGLALRLLAPVQTPLQSRGGAHDARAQETTVSSLGRLVSTS